MKSYKKHLKSKSRSNKHLTRKHKSKVLHKGGVVGAVFTGDLIGRTFIAQKGINEILSGIQHDDDIHYTLIKIIRQILPHEYHTFPVIPENSNENYFLAELYQNPIQNLSNQQSPLIFNPLSEENRMAVAESTLRNIDKNRQYYMLDIEFQ